MSLQPEDQAAHRLREHLRLTADAGWIGVTPGPEPDLVVNLYTDRRRHWPTTPIPPTFDGFAVQSRRSGNPRPAI